MDLKKQHDSTEGIKRATEKKKTNHKRSYFEGDRNGRKREKNAHSPNDLPWATWKSTG